MNEKTAKKVGEAYAFASVLQEMGTKMSGIMGTLLSDHALHIAAKTAEQIEALEAISEEHGTSEIVMPKAERTADKINRMADMYVGDEWDNPTEVLEWLSFFVGAAIVHWQLIAGSGEAMEDAALSDAATTGAEYYAELMTQLRAHAVEVGKARVAA